MPPHIATSRELRDPAAAERETGRRASWPGAPEAGGPAAAGPGAPPQGARGPVPTRGITPPVYVTKNAAGEESIRYRSAGMEPGRIYNVVWNGRIYGLRRVPEGVEFMRFYPDEGEQ